MELLWKIFVSVLVLALVAIALALRSEIKKLEKSNARLRFELTGDGVSERRAYIVPIFPLSHTSKFAIQRVSDNKYYSDKMYVDLVMDARGFDSIREAGDFAYRELLYRGLLFDKLPGQQE